jgi:hypothetical protein
MHLTLLHHRIKVNSGLPAFGTKDAHPAEI